MKNNKITFLQGESIKLCVPDLDDDSAISLWTAMMNNQEVCKLIGQAYFPQSKSEQIKYIQQTLANRTRLLLEVRSLKSEQFLGVISLSDIDQVNKRAQLSTVCPYKCDSVEFGALQARALLSDHAFKKLGLETVYSYQAYPENKRWAQASEVLGYLPSGFVLQSYLCDGKLTNRLIISLSAKRYWENSSLTGSLWPGADAARNALAKFSDKPSLADHLFEYVEKLQNLGSK